MKKNKHIYTEKKRSIMKDTLFIILAVFFILLSISVFTLNFVIRDGIRPLFLDHVASRSYKSSHDISTFLSSVNTTFRWQEKDRQLLHLISEYENASDESITKVRLHSYISYHLATKNYTKIEEKKVITSIDCRSALLSKSGEIFYGSNSEKCVDKFVSSEWFQQYLSAEEPSNKTYPPFMTIADHEGTKVYFSYLYYFEYEGEIYYLVYFADFEDIKPLFEDVSNISSDCGFIGKDQTVLYSGDKSLITYPNADKKLSDNQFETQRFSDKNGVTFCVLVSYAEENLRFVTHTTDHDLVMSQKNLFMIMVISVSIFFVFFVAIIILTLKKIFMRLSVLSEKMDNIRNGDYYVKMYDRRNDEVGRITEGFQIMAAQIKSDMDKIHDHEENERQLQYNLMVSTINPHFLYNTMNTISQLAELKRCDDVVKVNDALIAALKDNVKMRSYNIFDTVANEKEALENYMIIQKCLYTNLHYNFWSSDKDMNLSIPKNIIQPLLENAIIHGVPSGIVNDESASERRIDISVRSQNDEIVIIVADDGHGMDEEAVQKYFFEPPVLQSCTPIEHIGVTNIRLRLKYIYNDNYHLDVKSAIDKGTIVTISLPMKPEEKTD